MQNQTSRRTGEDKNIYDVSVWRSKATGKFVIFSTNQSAKERFKEEASVSQSKKYPSASYAKSPLRDDLLKFGGSVPPVEMINQFTQIDFLTVYGKGEGQKAKKMLSHLYNTNNPAIGYNRL
jgi:hypothetical protein